MENQYRVSATSRVTAVAGAIAKAIRDGDSVVLQAIGAGAVNQAVKSVALARGFLAGDQLEIVCAPSFAELHIDGNERTAVQLHIDRPGRPFPIVPAVSPQVRPGQ